MKKILTLETFDAKHGDSLMLYYGNIDDPNLILIDGGPPGVYRRTLRKRLQALKKTYSPSKSLPIQLTMISHIDDDHIKGILDLLEDLKQEKEDAKTPYLKLENIWYNTFDDIIGNIELPKISTSNVASLANFLSSDPIIKNLEEDHKAVIASTNQGRSLNTLNRFFKIKKNQGKKILTGTNTYSFDDNFKITVIHPNQERLQELQVKWDKDLKKAKKKGDNNIIFASIRSLDKSPFNLASIVCMIDYKRKRILLTGDARSDDILKGLEEAQLLRRGKVNIDILKIPHHGSDRNLSTQFFQKVNAKHYIFSADGRHHNPDKASLIMLLDGTGSREDFTVHFTNGKGKDDLEKTIDFFKKEKRRRKRKFKINILEKKGGSFKIDLLNKF